MAIVDGVTFLVLTITILRLSHRERPGVVATRLSLYMLYGLVLGHFLYDRFDLLVGGVILLSLGMLMTRLHYAWSFLVLAIGINLKIVPIVLAPLWIVSSLPASAIVTPLTGRSARRLIVAGVGRMMWIVIPAASCLLAFLWVFGPATMGFVSFQSSRGLEIGSLYTTGLLVLRELGLNVQTVFEFGAYGVRSPVASFAGAISPVLTLACVGLAYAVFLQALPLHLDAGGHRGDVSVATAAPVACIECAIALIMVVIATSKVFSPQFLLWLVPLLPLMSTKKRGTVEAWALFFLVCVTTNIITPLHFASDIVGHVTWTEREILASGPTRFGIATLVARNTLFGVLTLLMLRMVGRAPAV